MNRASIVFAWTRKSKGRLTKRGWTAFICTVILLAVAIRTATIRNSPASLSFQEAGHLSCQKRIARLEKQMAGNYAVFLDLLNEKQKQINRLNKQTSAIKDAERLPDAWK